MVNKTVILVRHAKSSWDFPSLRDFDRPLNPRGILNAPDMGNRLRIRQIKPEVLISSPAKRAKTTAQIISDQIGYPQAKIQLDKNLYHANRGEIMSLLKNQEDSHSSIMLFGHNPGFTDFANYVLSDGYIDNVPTTGVVALHFPIMSWRDIRPKQANLFFFDYPKKVL